MFLPTSLLNNAAALCRFAKDLGIVDESLPCSAVDLVQFGLQTLSVLVVVSISNAWVILAVIPCVCLSLYFAK